MSHSSSHGHQEPPGARERQRYSAGLTESADVAKERLVTESITMLPELHSASSLRAAVGSVLAQFPSK